MLKLIRKEVRRFEKTFNFYIRVQITIEIVNIVLNLKKKITILKHT